MILVLLVGCVMRGPDLGVFLTDVSAEIQPVIVIDAGHGGFDGGAVAKDGTEEKDITLSIAKELKKIIGEYPVEVVMTREEDTALKGNSPDSLSNIKTTKREDLAERKRIVDEAAPMIAISIHLNSYQEDRSVYGAQVFYPKYESIYDEKSFYPKDEQKRTELIACEQPSKLFAESVQKALEFNIKDGRERTILAKNDIKLFKNVLYPTILVECGFLSNDVECNRLKTADYQHNLAESIWQGVNEILCLEKQTKIQLIDSANKQ